MLPEPAPYAIVADRYTGHSDYADFVGFDFSGAVFKMQVRDKWNGGATRATITPTVSVSTTGGVTTSRVTWVIPESTMEAMPVDAVDPSRDWIGVYDIHITPSGGSKFVALRGSFTVRAGATE